MKAFIINQEDLDRLLLMVDRDPKHGLRGGSSDGSVRDDREEKAHEKAHRFYNYQVRKWIDEVTK